MAVVFAVSVLMLFSIAALTVDVGLLRWNRRSLTTDVDAAAIAAAAYGRELTIMSASRTCDETTLEPLVKARAVQTLAAQGDGSTILESEWDFDCSGRYGRVTVAATNDEALPFASVNGNADEVDVYAASSAQFGPVVGAERARPIPLCVDGSGSVQSAYGAWRSGTTSGDPYLGESVSGSVYKIILDSAYFNSVCNPAALASAGDFLWVDFDGDDNNTARNGRPCANPEDPSQVDKELTRRLLHGYACQVFTTEYTGGTRTGPNCRPDLTPAWESDSCPSITGTGGDDLNCIAGTTAGCVDQICAAKSKGKASSFDASLWPTPAGECPYIWTLVVYDQLVPETESEATHPRLRPVGFVNVVPRWLVNNKKDARYLAVEFIGLAAGQGVIGNPANDSRHHVLGVQLCGAESEQNCLG